MAEPIAVDGPPEQARCLQSVPTPVQAGGFDAVEMADQLAAALAAIRGYVPHRIWWEAGPAHALLAYQALRAM